MTTLLWSLTGVLALLWSGLAWASAALVRWAVGLLSTGGATGAVEAGKAAAAVELPAWLAPFVDTAWLTTLQGLVSWLADLAATGAPMAGSVLGWLVPLVWVGWAIGLLLLLLLAGGLHLLLRRIPKIGAPTPA